MTGEATSVVGHEPQIPRWSFWGSYRGRFAWDRGSGHRPVQGLAIGHRVIGDPQAGAYERAWRLPVAVTFRTRSPIAASNMCSRPPRRLAGNQPTRLPTILELGKAATGKAPTTAGIIGDNTASPVS